MRRRTTSLLLAVPVALAGTVSPGGADAVTGQQPLSLARVASAAPLKAVPAVMRRGFSQPVQVTSTVGDGARRLYVVEKTGRVRVVQQNVPAWTYFDLSRGINTDGERGLLGLAFSPGFAKDKRLFVTYTRKDGALVVARLTARTPGARSVSASTLRVLLVVLHPRYSNHNGGSIAFGADGLLYVGTGDGGGGGNPLKRAASLSYLNGKILRIDVRRSCGSLNYCIPASNPYRLTKGAKPQILHRGLRNPWRFSFDPSGRLWIGDVGQDAHEEVDVLAKGARGLNLGWSCWEGRYRFDAGQCRAGTKYTRPVLDIPHRGRTGYTGESVTGGYVYRGRAYPSARGHYIFGDFVRGTLWSYTSRSWRAIGSIPSVTGFGEADTGELYAVTIDGLLYRLGFTGS